MNMRFPFRSFVPLSLVLFSLATLGCVTTGQGEGGGDPTEISQEEIQEVGEVGNTYSLVQRLRPQWLQKRGRNSLQQPGQIIVYVDDTEQGGPESMRGIDVIDVQSVEFLRPNEATMRYGSGHDNGAILIHLKDGSS